MMVTIPTSALLAVMSAHNRLSSDLEIVVIKSLGLSPWKLSKPTITFALLATIFAIIISIFLPYGNKLAIYNIKRAAGYISLKDLKENEFYNEIPNLTIMVQKKINDELYYGITIIDNKVKNLITAREGRIIQSSGKIIFDLRSGTVVSGKNENYAKILFRHFYYVFNAGEIMKRNIKQERFMFPGELISNFNNGDIYKFEFSKRIAIPLSTFIMSLLGLKMGIIFHRSNRSINWLIALAVVFSYNIVLLFSENLISHINPFFAPWLANIVFTLLSVINIKKCLS